MEIKVLLMDKITMLYTEYKIVQTPEPRPIMQQPWPSRRVSTVRLFPLYDTLFLVGCSQSEGQSVDFDFVFCLYSVFVFVSVLLK